jgi:enoyl-CoA hydratase/carnithine racemase
MLTGRTLQPQEALAAGIVDAVVPAGELLDKALTLLRPYATGPTFAIGRIKKAAVQGFGMSLAEGLKLERQLLIELFKSDDAKEGVTAFVEKRKPNYTGR